MGYNFSSISSNLIAQIVIGFQVDRRKKKKLHHKMQSEGLALEMDHQLLPLEDVSSSLKTE